ncbi:MAG: tyrosine-type recombinase/integrase [Lentisphaeraceae bacterium]|nr:tyrosine-type recombinase/integrase [Lentisphaeraceae bacterium]
MSISEENELRDLFFNEAPIYGLSESTCYNYFLNCRKMWNAFNKHPREITNDELKNYFIEYIKTKPAKNSLHVTKAALNFMYRSLLGQERPIIDEVRGGRSRRLPRAMSMEEVEVMLSFTKKYHYKVMTCLAFSCGLRVSEAVSVRTIDINRFKMTLFIQGGKGNKDRYVPLPLKTYYMLRRYWDERRPPKPYIFVNPQTQKPYCRESLEDAFRLSRDEAKLNSQYTFHTLRHGYATCLIEAGIDIRMLQIFLGHCSLKTTLKYVHMTTKSANLARQILNDCFEQFNYPGHA